MASGIAKWVYRYMSQDVCPYNRTFARELDDESPFAPRERLASKDARARALLGMSQDEFSAAFRGSPMKRAKLRGLERRAAVVLGNVGTADDAEPLVREHAAWALDRLGGVPAMPPVYADAARAVARAPRKPRRWPKCRGRTVVHDGAVRRSGAGCGSVSTGPAAVPTRSLPSL